MHLGRGGLAPNGYRLVCSNGHDHVVGGPQVAALANTPCPWCRSPMQLAEWYDMAGRLQRSPAYANMTKESSNNGT
jgi:hypothetical protein